MSTLVLTTAATASAVAGFASLSLAMDRHFEDSMGRGRSPGGKRPWLRLGGVLGLLAALAASLRLQGSAQGWVLWLGVLTLSALLVVGVLAARPFVLPRVGLVMALVAVLAFVIH